VWLKEGDRNSRFFHPSTIIQRKRNLIEAIKDDSWEWILDGKNIRQHLVSKFKELFIKEEVSFPEDLGNLIELVISDAENVDICSIPTQRKISRVVFDMPDLKALGMMVF
jgi:hypothetical protein